MHVKRNSTSTKRDIEEQLTAYLGYTPNQEILGAAVSFKKNTNHLSRSGREFIPVSFGHQIMRNVLSRDDVESLNSLVDYLQENHQPFTGSQLIDTQEASWLAWHIQHINLDIISTVQEKIKNSLRNVLYYSAHDDEKRLILKAYDHLSETLPQAVTYHLYRKNSSDGIVEHRDSESIFATVVVTLEEREGALITDTYSTSQNIGPCGIQLLAPNEVHSVPQIHRTFGRKTIIFAL